MQVAAPSLAEVLGRGAREIRLDAGATLEEVAHAARDFGLSWSTGRVGDFEAGRTSPTLPTLIAYTAALGKAIGRRVSIAELISIKRGPVQVNDSLQLEGGALRAALSDDDLLGDVKLIPLPTTMRIAVDTVSRSVSSTGWPRQMRAVSPELRAEVLRDFKESDVRMCKNLGLAKDPVKGAAAMAALWGHTFTKERAQRAESDANAQALGQISRRLKAELQEVLGDGNR